MIEPRSQRNEQGFIRLLRWNGWLPLVFVMVLVGVTTMIVRQARGTRNETSAQTDDALSAEGAKLPRQFRSLPRPDDETLLHSVTIKTIDGKREFRIQAVLNGDVVIVDGHTGKVLMVKEGVLRSATHSLGGPKIANAAIE